MALNSLKGKTQTPSGVQIIDMGELRKTNPDVFPNGGDAMDYKAFERDIRPHNFIYVRHDKNSVAFTLQNGPIGENGVNGCQVTNIIEVAKMIIEGLNKAHPCEENSQTIKYLQGAIDWQNKRTADREERGVEGKNET